MATDVERVVHGVAHAKGVLDGGELVLGEAGAQLGRHAPQEAGDEGIAGGADRRRQPFGNLCSSKVAKPLTQRARRGQGRISLHAVVFGWVQAIKPGEVCASSGQIGRCTRV